MQRLAPPLALALVLASVAAASEVRPSRTACEREALPGRAYIECLQAALQESDRALQVALDHALVRVDKRDDLAATQRTRWRNTLQEAQGRFIQYRNYECQNVAPYEGREGRIGAFEERLACLVDKNIRRSRELTARYGGQ